MRVLFLLLVSFCSHAQIAGVIAATANNKVSVEIQASGLTFFNLAETTLDLYWTRGSGDACIVVVRSGGAVNADPTNATTYTANAAFGSGSEIGTGNFVVYKGVNRYVRVTGLTANTTYHVQIFEYDGTAGSEVYNTDTSDGNGSQKTDYYGTLIDDWISTRNLRFDANLTDVDSWIGNVNSLTLTPHTLSEKITASAYLPIDGTDDAYNLPSTMSVNGDLTMHIYLNCPTKQNAESRLFHAVGSPSLILRTEISGANSNLGLFYNGVSYDFGAALPFDANDHVLTLKITASPNEANVFLDGVQVGSTRTITGGGVNWTSGQTRRFFRNASTGGSVPWKGSVKKIRIAAEATSDANILAVGASGSPFRTMPTEPRRIRRVYTSGQSNATGANTDASNLPAPYDNPIGNTYIWMSGFRRFDQLEGGVNARGILGAGSDLWGPIVSMMYRLNQRYPDDVFHVIFGAVSGSGLEETWIPPSGSNYSAMLALRTAANVWNGIEQKTVVEDFVYWNQGERDSQVLSYANNYSTNEPLLFAGMKADLGITHIYSHNLHSSYNTGSYPYFATVKAAKSALVDADVTLLSAEDVPIQVDTVHYTAQGYIDVGEEVGLLVPDPEL